MPPASKCELRLARQVRGRPPRPPEALSRGRAGVGEQRHTQLAASRDHHGGFARRAECRPPQREGPPSPAVDDALQAGKRGGEADRARADRRRRPVGARRR